MLVDNTPGCQRFNRALQKAAALYPELLIPVGFVRAIKRAPPGVSTCAITRKWVVMVNDDFYMKLKEPEAMFVAAHEIMHPCLSYFERGTSLGIFNDKLEPKNPASAIFWNIASDMVINTSLEAMGLPTPTGILKIPSDYKGKADSEHLFRWLKKNKPEMVQTIEISIGKGCGMSPDGTDTGKNEAETGKGKEEKEIPNSATIRNMIAEASRGLGKGSKLNEMYNPPPPTKENWKQLLRLAFSTVSNDMRHNDSTTYKRPKRRKTLRFPRYQSLDPSIAICVDVSGSMARQWVEDIISKTRSLAGSFPNINVAFVVHTAEVHFANWINASTRAEKIAETVDYSGGTAVRPAYEALRKLQRRFDAVVHFTDMEVESPWPDPPCRRFYVGHYDHGTDYSTAPPRGTRIIPCNPPPEKEEETENE